MPRHSVQTTSLSLLSRPKRTIREGRRGRTGWQDGQAVTSQADGLETTSPGAHPAIDAHPVHPRTREVESDPDFVLCCGTVTAVALAAEHQDPLAPGRLSALPPTRYGPPERSREAVRRVQTGLRRCPPSQLGPSSRPRVGGRSVHLVWDHHGVILERHSLGVHVHPCEGTS